MIITFQATLLENVDRGVKAKLKYNKVLLLCILLREQVSYFNMNFSLPESVKDSTTMFPFQV